MATTKRKRLTLEEKCEVYKKFKAGIPKEKIMSEYGIKRDAYYCIIRSDPEAIKNSNPYYLNEKRKSLKKSSFELLDAALIKWYTEERDKGNYISRQLIKEKALSLNEIITGSSSFNASTGWLEAFKRRYGIRDLNTKGESLGNNDTAAEKFVKFFKNKISTENLLLDNIYNADETEVYSKTLVSHNLASCKNIGVSGIKETKKHISALCCSNASGNHRIRLLTMGKSRNSRCLNNYISEQDQKQNCKSLESLGVKYTNQSSGWMSRFIFLQWYKNEFIPEVLGQQKKSGKVGKVILILDNAPYHPTLKELNAINDNFEIIYLPPNVITTIQPMDQGVISTMKQLYKKDLLRQHLLNDNQQEAIELLKQLHLRDILPSLHCAWSKLNSSALQKAWKPIFRDSSTISRSHKKKNLPIPIVQDDVNENINLPIPHYFHQENECKEWFQEDSIECGSDPLSDGAINYIVTNFKNEEECGNVKNEIDEFPKNNTSMSSSSKKPIDSLKTLKTWLITKELCSPLHLQYLQELENLVKSHSSQIIKD